MNYNFVNTLFLALYEVIIQLKNYIYILDKKTLCLSFNQLRQVMFEKQQFFKILQELSKTKILQKVQSF